MSIRDPRMSYPYQQETAGANHLDKFHDRAVKKFRPRFAKLLQRDETWIWNPQHAVTISGF
jgi:hypothetical protein